MITTSYASATMSPPCVKAQIIGEPWAIKEFGECGLGCDERRPVRSGGADFKNAPRIANVDTSVSPATAPRILLVDDDDSVRDVISVILKEEGYRCIAANSAEAALGELDGDEETPLVISDM